MKSRALLAVCVVIAAFAAPSVAQPADALKNAQSAFDQAQLDYLQGNYDKAAEEFEAAYKARQFPQFLYNVGASYHMKGKKTSDVEAYENAVKFYNQYLTEEPNATDKESVQKRIGILSNEIKRLKDLAASNPPPNNGSGSGSDGSGSGSGSQAVAPQPPPPPSDEVKKLGDVTYRGLVVIESEPQNATIYLDDKKKGPFGTTPWSGTIEGEHKVMIEKRGYQVADSTISADPTKLFVYHAVMSQVTYLGWLEVTSNIPGSDIYIDNKEQGAVGRTPLSQNIKPGKHTIWVTVEGYTEYKEEVEVVQGESVQVKAELKGSPYGKLDVIGLGTEDSQIFLDGKVLCERGPCLKGVPQGDHELEVKRPGYKPYQRRVNVQAKTQTQVRTSLAPEPSRSDAVIAYILAAGFGGAGIYLGLQANKLRDDLNKEIGNSTNMGAVPVDSNDPRFTRGKIFAIAADSCFAIAGITALTAVYYTFRDKGQPSTALIDVRALAVSPEIGPNYAGVAMGGHF